MTISTTTNRVSYAGNGATTAFAFGYYFLANADLVVIKRNTSTGAETTQTLTTHYTVSGAGNPAGGTVTFVTAPSASEEVIIYRDPAVKQEVDLVNNDPLPVETSVEQPLDRLTMICQRLADRIGRALRLTDGDTSGATTTITPSADKFLGWNSGGTALENKALATIGAVQLSDATPQALTGTGSAGTSAMVSRSDHKHASGTAATKNTGTSGDAVPLLNANALHTGHETFQGRLNVASSVGGTVDAITMTFDPAFTALVDEMEFGGRATGANTSTTPTVNPSGLGALTIVKENLAALAAGDIVGAGHPLWFRYNAAAGKAVLLNPKGGGVSANFSAHKNGTDQTVADATATKVTFTTESWDTGGYYDAANSRWTPPAGKRVISCVCYMVGSAGIGPCRLLIYKNGVEYLRGPVMGLPTNDQGVWVVAEVDANGTDYFEIYEEHATGSSKVILGLAAYTYFQGF